MEPTTINNAIKEVRELLNELKSNLSPEEINRIRKDLYKKEAIYRKAIYLYLKLFSKKKMV